MVALGPHRPKHVKRNECLIEFKVRGSIRDIV